MAASLRLARPGVLSGLKIIKIKECQWGHHVCRASFRPIFQSSFFFGKSALSFCSFFGPLRVARLSVRAVKVTLVREK